MRLINDSWDTEKIFLHGYHKRAEDCLPAQCATDKYFIRFLNFPNFFLIAN